MALQSQSSPRTAEPQPCAQPNGGVEPLADQSCNQWAKLTIDHDGIAVRNGGSGRCSRNAQ